MTVELYPLSPVQRFIDTVLPKLNVPDASNPILQHLMQIPEFGWHNCTPQHRGQKLRESFSHVSAPHLLEQGANAKRWIVEHVITYIDGKLPVWLRAGKFIYDLAKILQYVEKVVATLKFFIALIQQEIALANAFANESLLFVDFIRQSISPTSLRIQAETVTLAVLDVATAALTQQINENNATLACLI